jgi:hypothetical protein
MKVGAVKAPTTQRSQSCKQLRQSVSILSVLHCAQKPEQRIHCYTGRIISERRVYPSSAYDPKRTLNA